MLTLKRRCQHDGPVDTSAFEDEFAVELRDAVRDADEKEVAALVAKRADVNSLTTEYNHEAWRAKARVCLPPSILHSH